MRAGRPVTNGTMRNLGLEAHRATAELSDLVGRGVAVRIGERRHARYLLAPEAPDGAVEDDGEPSAPEPFEPAENPGTQELIMAALADGSELSRRELEERTGIKWTTVLRALKILEDQGRVVPTAPARSPKRRYRRP
jgi:ATP-dependent DNA helicase RecG